MEAAYGLADRPLYDCDDVRSVAVPRHTLVLEQDVIVSGGSGDCDAVTVVDTVRLGVNDPVRLDVGEKVSVDEGVGDCDGVGEFDVLVVAVALRVTEFEGVAVLLVVTVLEDDVVPDAVCVSVRDGDTVDVIESDEPADGVCDCDGVAEHVGATSSPAVVQPSGHGHGCGDPDPVGQNEPMGHTLAVSVALPSGQKCPARHGPLQRAVVRPVAFPNFPAGHSVKFDDCARQNEPRGHGAGTTLPGGQKPPAGHGAGATDAFAHEKAGGQRPHETRRMRLPAGCSRT